MIEVFFQLRSIFSVDPRLGQVDMMVTVTVTVIMTRAQSQLPFFPRSELTLSHIGVWASGEWECSVSTVQGNTSKKVEIVVLETSASYCPAERVTNNRGDFRLAASAL